MPLGAQRPPSVDEFTMAVEQGNASLVEDFLLRGSRPDDTDSRGERPLPIAVKNSEYELAQRLLAAGASPNLPGRDGSTPLVMAVERGDRAFVSLLLFRGADPNLVADVLLEKTGRSQSISPFSVALETGDYEMARILLKAGASPLLLGNPDYQGLDPLALPALKVDVDARLWRSLGRAMENGSNPSFARRMSEQDRSMLEMTLEGDWIGINRLYDSGYAGFGEGDVTPLMVAAYQGDVAGVGLMLRRGENPARRDDEGRTALAYAGAGNHIDVVKRFLQEDGGANGTFEMAVSPLTYALMWGNPQMLRVLIEGGVTPQVEDESGMSLLMLAAWYGDLASLQLLLPLLDGNQPQAQRDEGGRTALDWALAGFSRERTRERAQGLSLPGANQYPVIRLLAYRRKIPGDYRIRPTQDVHPTVAHAWSPGRQPAMADDWRHLRPSPLPSQVGDGDKIIYSILRDEEQEESGALHH